ncbi:uncharacterized protein LOC129565878 [Sitodiplosis mosellana]|uniref:uncharacterized protein LOC129565878 n=1 Tax=Sitodiplosis mosellana TaxID=263140 RepID=UPI00244376CA|nr:uncharacterized protein LOC129565878 [Sitodiplosis mosellana]
MSDIDAISVSDEISDDIFNDFVTLGKLSAFKTPIKWQFPDTKHCPLCGISCSTRNIALIHFRNTHADTSMVCVLCDILFCDAAQLLYHHALQHQNHLPPELKASNTITEFKENVVKPQKSAENEETKEEDDQDDDDDDDGDDLITLHGCGKTTHWRFPRDIKHCPVHTCRIQFGIRYDAINHYKKRHAKHSILCPICVKPICSQKPNEFVRHYRKVHPYQLLPYNMVARSKANLQVKETLKKGDGKPNDFEMPSYVKDSTKSPKLPLKIQTMKKETAKTMENHHNPVEEEEDDLITLRRGGKWRFPNGLKGCPIHTCYSVFKTRRQAIAHFKRQHAKYAVLCTLCEKPINARNYRPHCKRMHPNGEISVKPKATPTNFVPCKICGKHITGNMNKHLKVHSKKRFICPMKGCQHEAKQLDTTRDHWQKNHSHLPFPEIRKASNTPRNIKQQIKTMSNTPSQNVTSDQQDSLTRPEDNESEENLLTPLRTASEPSSEEEINLQCTDCRYVSKTVFALKMHQHNKHSMVKRRKKKRVVSQSRHYDTTTDDDDEEVKRAAKRRRLVKKRARDSGNNDRDRDETSNLERSEGQDDPLEQHESKHTLTPFNGLTDLLTFVQAKADNDPSDTAQPLDLSIPKVIYVLDSDEEAIIIDSEDDVKPPITSQDNSSEN